MGGFLQPDVVLDDVDNGIDGESDRAAVTGEHQHLLAAFTADALAAVHRYQRQQGVAVLDNRVALHHLAYRELRAKFPARADDTDELPNTLVVHED